MFFPSPHVVIVSKRRSIGHRGWSKPYKPRVNARKSKNKFREYTCCLFMFVEFFPVLEFGWLFIKIDLGSNSLLSQLSAKSGVYVNTVTGEAVRPCSKTANCLGLQLVGQSLDCFPKYMGLLLTRKEYPHLLCGSSKSKVPKNTLSTEL